jgi:RimJ/RimL family protein N-acetyltransferase
VRPTPGDPRSPAGSGLIDNAASCRVMEKLGLRPVGEIEHARLPYVLYDVGLNRRSLTPGSQ